MIDKLDASHGPKHCGSKHRFSVHLLKVTRLPTHVPSPTGDDISHPHVRRDALKVTALYNSHQIALGDFPVWMNECVIDRKLICQFSLSKPAAQSKLHLYIDQIRSSGLTGHLALDLHEFVREDESEVHVKYPLYANISGSCKGPVLKVVIKSSEITNFESLINEESDIFLLPPPSTEKFHGSGIHNTEDVVYSILDDCHFDMKGRALPRHMDEASFSQLEGALSDIGEKLKTLLASFKSKDDFQTGDQHSGVEIDYQSSTTSPLLSSLHTGTSVDSRSEIYEEQCPTEIDEVFDSSFDLGHSAYHLTIPRHSSATYESQTMKLKHMKALRHDRHTSCEELPSESWLRQSSNNVKSHLVKPRCHEECFLCSSEHMLQSYEGLQGRLSKSQPLSRSQPISLHTKSFHLDSSELNKARMSSPVIGNELSTKCGKEAAPVEIRKGPGLLKGLVGAVVVAGVSLLGVRSSHMSREQSQSLDTRTNLGRTSSSSVSSDLRSEKFSRPRYSFRR